MFLFSLFGPLPDDAPAPEFAVKLRIEAFAAFVDIEALAAFEAKPGLVFHAGADCFTVRMISTFHSFLLLHPNHTLPVAHRQNDDIAISAVVSSLN